MNGEPGKEDEILEEDSDEAEHEAEDVEVVQADGDEEVEAKTVIKPEKYTDVPKCTAEGNERIPRSLRSPIRHPAAEVDRHNLTHLPYR